MAFRKSDANMMRTAWELSAGMLSFVVAIGIGYWFGGLLDAWLGTSPWLTAAFLCLGFVAGVLNVYRTVSGAMRRPSSAGPVFEDVKKVKDVKDVKHWEPRDRE
jgi:F0F1-type ATP synthase assembly protein I